jgi:TonB family protein
VPSPAKDKLHTRSRSAPKHERKRLQPELLLASRAARPAPQLYSEAPTVSAQLRNDPLAQLVKTPELPHAVATVENDRGSALRRAVGTIPGFGFLKKKRTPQDFTPAKAVRQIRPSSPMPLPGEVPVRVRLNVGKDGRVVSAELVSKRVDARLAQSALEAAREWQFEPARVEEKAVDTEVVVQFRFVPSSESL